MAGSRSTSSLANWRSVGISSIPGNSPRLPGEAGNKVHGARKVNSSRASRHCRNRLCAHHRTWLSGSASRLRTIASADVASRSRHSRAAASVVGGAAAADAISFCSWASGARAAPPASVHDNPEGVTQSVKPALPQDLLIGKCEQTGPQGQQMARQVAAVHGRNVDGQQRLQRLRVVPVVEVAPVSLQSCHRVEERSPCVRRVVRLKCSRSRRRINSPGAPVPCWSARCGARPWPRDAPDSYPAAANDLPGRRRSRRTPRSFGKSSGGRGSGRPSILRRGAGAVD